MKKRTKIIIKVIGLITIGLSFIAGYYPLKQNIINGLDFVTILLFVIGVYLTLATEQSLKSWLFFIDNDDD